MFPDFSCECEKCSPYSPGPVANDEEIAFLLIDPLHYDSERATVVPAAFQELTNRDLSILRIKSLDEPQLSRTISQLESRGGGDRLAPVRKVEQACIAKVSDLRSSEDDLGRCFGIYDTALDDCASHASIFTRRDVLESRLQRKRMRAMIHQSMTKRVVSVDAILSKLDAA